MPIVFVLSWLVVFGAMSRPALAQAQTPPPRDGRLLLTVVDQSGGVIPGADVTVLGLDEVTKKKTIPPVKTSDKGVLTVEGLPPGRYSVSSEFPGFEIGLLRDIRIKSGDNKHVLVLPLKKLSEAVTVERDKQVAAADRAMTFGTALTREQIEALSDDPDEMARQLQDMAGPGAVIRVDSFEGQQLPPKSMIKSIHITRDAFAAETHSAGALFVDIVTQPGMGQLRGGGRFGFYDSAMEGSNPLIPRKGPAQSRQFSANLGGTLIKEKSGFSLSVMQGSSYRTPNMYATTSSGQRLDGNLNLRTPTSLTLASGTFDYAITKDQTVRAFFTVMNNNSDNFGVGIYDYAERAYSMAQRNYTLRLQEAGPLGRRFFTNTRFSLNWSDSSTKSAVEAPTIIVNGAFNQGGAQRAGGRHTRAFSLASDLDYVRGINSWRTGVQIDGGQYRSNDTSNYLGTFTFAPLLLPDGSQLDALAAFNAGLPAQFTRRIGDPNVAYWNVQVGGYVQDDLRLRKNLTLSPGVRVELQTHLKDYVNVGPRIGLTWAPFKSGKTTLRGSWGIFYDWLSTGVYEQTLRNDGFRQRDIKILDPSFPDPGPVGDFLPSGRYLLGPDLQMARNMRLSAGIDQQITKRLRVNATYADTRGDGLLAGVNLNTPLNGIYPDPTFLNVVEAVSAGKSRVHSLSVNGSLSLAPAAASGGSSGAAGMAAGYLAGMAAAGGVGGTVVARVAPSAPAADVPKAAAGTAAAPAGAAAKAPAPPQAPGVSLFSWRRGLSVFENYGLASSHNNTDGAFTAPASGTLATEWGPSSGDVRHRVSFGVYSGALRNFNASVYFSASSAPPLTIRSAVDLNGDGLYNDRPFGVGRNSARTAGQWTSYGTFSYSIGLGKRPATTGGGGITTTTSVVMVGSGGVVMASSIGGVSSARYRLIISANVQNLTNHANYSGFGSFIGTSDFLRPTMVDGVRRIDLSMSFSF
jgi:hypothetical protein